MNPFITLTQIKREGPIRININSIVLFEQRKYTDSPRKYTYILVLGGTGCSRHVEETPEQIEEMISHAALSIPFTHIKGA
jgi:hypothetical protein